MKIRPTIHQPTSFGLDVDDARSRLTEAVAKAFELLKESPDTFLGRQHHDFIPLPRDEE